MTRKFAICQYRRSCETHTFPFYNLKKKPSACALANLILKQQNLAAHTLPSIMKTFLHHRLQSKVNEATFRSKLWTKWFRYSISYSISYIISVSDSSDMIYCQLTCEVMTQFGQDLSGNIKNLIKI